MAHIKKTIFTFLFFLIIFGQVCAMQRALMLVDATKEGGYGIARLGGGMVGWVVSSFMLEDGKLLTGAGLCYLSLKNIDESWKHFDKMGTLLNKGLCESLEEETKFVTKKKTIKIRKRVKKKLTKEDYEVRGRLKKIGFAPYEYRFYCVNRRYKEPVKNKKKEKKD